MKRGKWEIINGRIEIISQEGDIFHIDAHKIYNSAFNRQNPILDNVFVEEYVTTTLNNISFSKFPAVPVFSIFGDYINGLHFQLGLSTNTNIYPVSEITDQIIIDNHWHPIVLSDILEAQNILRSIGINNYFQLISLGQLIKLRSLID